MMRAIDASPQNEALWKPIENKLGSSKADYDQQAPADSWFINDARGIQVARSPRSDESRGKDYSHRDYFHGQGADLPEPTAGLKPIDRPHLSVVYRSTTTNQLKVAFSVPIDNGRSGSARKIIGVLAMSVDLGEFNVLEKQLPAGHEVVLIDLRGTSIEDQMRRGLILHRQTSDAARPDQTAAWVSPELLQRIDALLANSESASAGGSSFLTDFRDEAVTDGRLYWGAIERVVDKQTDEQPRDTGWLVLVQEPVARK
jgi:hypothetical protein